MRTCSRKINKTYSFSDIENHQTPRLVIIEGDTVMLKAQAYHIELHRLNSPKKLINWIRHLVKKPWVDGATIQQLIDTTYQHFGWKTDSHL